MFQFFFTSTHERKIHKHTFLPCPKSLEDFVNALGLLTNVDETQARLRNSMQKIFNRTYLKEKLAFQILG